MRPKLTLIHIVTLPIAFEPGSFIDPKPLERAGRKVLEEAKKIAKGKGVNTKTRLGEA